MLTAYEETASTNVRLSSDVTSKCFPAWTRW